MDDRPVAMVIPLEEEFRELRALLSGMRRFAGCGPWEVWEGRASARRVVAIISDCGAANAGAATERLIAQFDPAAVLVGGSAGAHDPELLPGDLVVGSSYCVAFPVAVQEDRRRRGLHPKGLRFRQDGRRVHVQFLDGDPGMLQLAEHAAEALAPTFGAWTQAGWPDGVPRREARVVRGRIAFVDGWTTTESEILELRQAYGTACEDMESALVAQVSAMHGLPLATVRCISDNEAACHLLPEQVAPCVTSAGARAAAILARVAALV